MVRTPTWRRKYWILPINAANKMSASRLVTQKQFLGHSAASKTYINVIPSPSMHLI